MTGSELVGFTGVGLAGGAYVPQLAHLIREHCSAGVSRAAFVTWLVASVLLTARAVAISEAVFVVLGVVQIGALAAIIGFTTRYRGRLCATHARGAGER